MAVKTSYSCTVEDSEIVHLVTLSNGERIGIHELEDGLSISSWNATDIEPDAYLCKIDADGIKVYSNSGDAAGNLIQAVQVRPKRKDG